MPVLPYLRRATIQPTYPVLNRRHPIAKDIAFFCTQRGGKFVDLVTGAVGTFNGAGKQPLARGQARPAATIQANLTSAGSDYYEFPHNPAWNLIGDISLLWSGVIATGSAFRHFAGKHAAGGGADNPFDFRTDSGAAPRAALVRANAGGATINSSAFNAMALGVYNHAGVTCNAANNGSHNYYNNGGPAEVTSAVSGNAATSNTQTLRVGRRADGAVQMNGTTEAVIGWARIVGGGEFTSLWRNIWQLTEPTELWSIFFDDGAAAQVAYPIADIATNGWLPSSGTDL